MNLKEKKFIKYCLAQKLLSRAQLQDILTRGAHEIKRQGVCACVASTLGWAPAQARQVFQAAQQAKWDDISLTDSSPGVPPEKREFLATIKRKRPHGVPQTTRSLKKRRRPTSSAATSRSNSGTNEPSDKLTRNAPHPATTPGGTSAQHVQHDPAMTQTRLLPSPKSSNSTETLEQLGPYVIESEIATGGMAKIYKAYHPGLERQVALKVLLAGDVAPPSQKERFLREAKLAAQLKHPHIVTVYDVGLEGNYYYLVMEYIQGQTLDQWYRKKKNKLSELVGHLVLITQALAYAHQQGVIHRDIKPTNIMITDNEVPMLMDFGVARKIGDRRGKITRAGQIVGSPRYMSPEQARGKRADARSDIYSFGAMLYELLGRRPVVPPADIMTMLEHVIHKEPPALGTLVHGLPRELETICMKCLAKQPNQRYQSMEELSADLQHFLAGEHITAKPLRRYYRFLKILQQHWHLALLMFLCLSLGLIIMGLLVYYGQEIRHLTQGQPLSSSPVTDNRQPNKNNSASQEKNTQAMAAYLKAIKYAKNHPGCLDEILKRFRQIQQVVHGTPWEKEVRTEIRNYIREELEILKTKVRKLQQQGTPEKAQKLVENFLARHPNSPLMSEVLKLKKTLEQDRAIVSRVKAKGTFETLPSHGQWYYVKKMYIRGIFRNKARIVNTYRITVHVNVPSETAWLIIPKFAYQRNYCLEFEAQFKSGHFGVWARHFSVTAQFPNVFQHFKIKVDSEQWYHLRLVAYHERITLELEGCRVMLRKRDHTTVHPGVMGFVVGAVESQPGKVILRNIRVMPLP